MVVAWGTAPGDLVGYLRAAPRAAALDEEAPIFGAAFRRSAA